MNIRKTLWERKISLALTIAIIAAFFLLSKNGFFIPVETIQSLSFNQAFSPQNLFWFWLAHASPAHLLANAFGILVFGSILEKRIGSKRLFGLFIIAAIGAPLLFTLFFPTALVGASGGVAALIAVSLLLEPKKALLGTIVGIALMLGLSPLASLPLQNQQQVIQQQTIQTQTDLEKAIEQQNPIQQQLQEKLQELQIQNQQLLETKQFQETIPIENSVHAIGAVLGILFLAGIAPEIVRKEVKKISQKSRSLFHR
jgi:hypothetical protein